ncbi:squalene/phytoene synthase family protein [Paenibacillus lutrae]|nr:squalene/phytoene synthase family protein [Paenibacillus lutrae]
MNKLLKDAMKMLLLTSRTFYIPIARLSPGLKEAVASAYLCMRAIDEIEDHPDLPVAVKVELLEGISRILEESGGADDYAALFSPHKETLPPVSLRIHDWIVLCPKLAAGFVTKSTAKMSRQMSEWVEKGWDIKTEEDLDYYTYCVAGAVGELLSDLWKWYDGTESDPAKAVAFGRGLQAVNILRNRKEDMVRGVDFFPDQWSQETMIQYTKRNLMLADAYINELKPGPARNFCRIPFELARGTLKAITSGVGKLNRKQVTEIVDGLGTT